jgi:hypothetical protein
MILAVEITPKALANTFGVIQMLRIPQGRKPWAGIGERRWRKSLAKKTRTYLHKGIRLRLRTISASFHKTLTISRLPYPTLRNLKNSAGSSLQTY